jgi:hypothetical protein
MGRFHEDRSYSPSRGLDSFDFNTSTVFPQLTHLLFLSIGRPTLFLFVSVLRNPTLDGGGMSEGALVASVAPVLPVRSVRSLTTVSKLPTFALIYLHAFLIMSTVNSHV